MRKHGDAKKYNAHVIHVGHECDIAMVIIYCQCQFVLLFINQGCH